MPSFLDESPQTLFLGWPQRSNVGQNWHRMGERGDNNNCRDATLVVVDKSEDPAQGWHGRGRYPSWHRTPLEHLRKYLLL